MIPDLKKLRYKYTYIFVSQATLSHYTVIGNFVDIGNIRHYFMDSSDDIGIEFLIKLG